MGSVRAWRSLSLVLLVALVAVTTTATLASPIGHEGGSVKKVKVVTESVANSVDTGGVFAAQLPGATISMGVPDGTQALFLIRFSAESACYGRVAGWCSIQILVGGQEAAPGGGENYAFDSVNPEGSHDYEAHAAERVAGPLGPGTYTVKVQRTIHLTDDPPFLGQSVFRLDDWTLAVERIEVG